MTNEISLKYIDHHFFDDNTFSECPKNYAMIGFKTKEYAKVNIFIKLVSLENFYKDTNVKNYEIVDFVGLVPVLDIVS